MPPSATLPARVEAYALSTERPNDERNAIIALSVAVTIAIDAIDPPVGPGSSTGHSLRYEALLDQELNDVWGEAEFDILDYVCHYQTDQLF